MTNGGYAKMRRLKKAQQAVPAATPRPVPPRCTDHALVRFMERCGFHIAGIREAIERSLAASHGAAVALGGADHVITVDGLSFVVRGGNVVTVVQARDVHDRASLLGAQDR